MGCLRGPIPVAWSKANLRQALWARPPTKSSKLSLTRESKLFWMPLQVKWSLELISIKHSHRVSLPKDWDYSDKSMTVNPYIMLNILLLLCNQWKQKHLNHWSLLQLKEQEESHSWIPSSIRLNKVLVRVNLPQSNKQCLVHSSSHSSKDPGLHSNHTWS